MTKGLVAAAAIAAGVMFAVDASAETFGFSAIIQAGDGAAEFANHADAEGQLFVDITDFGGGMVLFTFRNEGPVSMYIDGVYFDDGTLLGISSLIDADENGGDPGVDFTGGSAAPPDLPGGNEVGFSTTAGFLADADNPSPFKGINPGESLGVVFQLVAGKTFADVLAAMDLGFADGGLVIGINVQGFDDGGSEAFITNGGTPIPMPAGVALGLAGLVPVVARRRR